MKKSKLLSSLIIMLCLMLSLGAFVGCKNTEEEETQSETEQPTPDTTVLTDFDYENADISKYILLPRSTYISNTVTLSSDLLVTDEEVANYINQELFSKKSKVNGDQQVTDQPIKFGDSAFIYYTGYIDGEAFSTGSNADDETPFELSIGSGTFIPGFEEGLIGIIPEQTSKESPHDLYLTFPETYKNADYAGKDVVFKVWIVYVVQYTVPELNEDYVQNVQGFSGTVEEYQDIIRSGLQQQADASIQTQMMTAITNHLMEEAQILEYPQESVEYWYQQYIEQYEYYMQYYTQYGYSFSSFDDFMTQFMGISSGESWEDLLVEQAKNSVKEKLIAHAIAKQENISISDEDLNNAIEYFIEYYEINSGNTYSAEEIINGLGEDYIKEYVLSEKVTKILTDNCTVIYSDD